MPPKEKYLDRNKKAPYPVLVSISMSSRATQVTNLLVALNMQLEV